MFTLISLIIIAIIAFVALILFNMKATSSQNKSDTVSVKNEDQQSHPEEIISPLEVDTLVQGNTQQENIQEETVLSINDDAYRKALKSFHADVKKPNNGQPKGKMKDDDFRRALQSMSDKPNNVD
jgi:hypothetical protein